MPILIFESLQKGGWGKITFLFLCFIFFIIRINIIATIFKSIITTIITTIVVADVAAIVNAVVISNFIVYKLFLVF